MCIVYYTVHNPCHCIHLHRDPDYCDEFLAHYLEAQEAANAAAAVAREEALEKEREEKALALALAATAGGQQRTGEGNEAQRSTDADTASSVTSEESVTFPPTFEAKVITFHPYLHGLRLKWEGCLFQSHNLDLAVRPDGFECPHMVSRFEDVAWTPPHDMNDDQTSVDDSEAENEETESEDSTMTSYDSVFMGGIYDCIDPGTNVTITIPRGPPVPRPAEKLYCPLCVIHGDIVRIMTEATTGMDETAARLAELKEKERKQEEFAKKREAVQKVINEGQRQVVKRMRQQREARVAAEREREYQQWLAHEENIRESIRKRDLVHIAIPRSFRDHEELNERQMRRGPLPPYSYDCESPYRDPEEALRENIRRSYGEYGIVGSYHHRDGQKMLLVVPEAWEATLQSPYPEHGKGSLEKSDPEEPAEPEKPKKLEILGPGDDLTWYKGPSQIYEARLNAGLAMAEASAAAQGPRKLQEEQDHWDKVQVYCGDYCDLCKKRKAWGK